MADVKDALLSKFRTSTTGIDDWTVDSTQESLSSSISFRLRPRTTRRQLLILIYSQLLVIVLLSISLFASLSMRRYGSSGKLDGLPVSPGDQAISYQRRLFHKYGFEHSIFAAPPSSEVDAAWHRLLKGMNIGVSKEFLEPYNATSIPLKDGSGYAVQLGMYHDLHCLKRLKHWIYRDHYLPSLTQAQFLEHQAHIEHCMDWLRESALCRGDTTLSVLQWSAGGGSNVETEYPLPRQCVDSDKLLTWSEARAIDLSKDI